MTIQLGLGDSGSQVTVDLGQPIEVRLTEIAGSGHLWQIVNDIEPHLVVSAHSEHPGDPETDSSVADEKVRGPAVGGASERVFEIIAQTPTDTIVKFRRFPPWLSENEADATFEVRITTRNRPPRRCG